MLTAMPQKSRLKLPRLHENAESIGERIARLRRERGYTQVELAEKIGLTQNLISAYECGRLRLNAEMVIRFAQALVTSADDLLGLQAAQTRERQPARKVLRRLQQIERLPPTQQKTLLQTIDTFIKAAGK